MPTLLAFFLLTERDFCFNLFIAILKVINMEKKSVRSRRKRYDVKFKSSIEDKRDKERVEVEIDLPQDLTDKIKEVVSRNFKYRSEEHFIQVAVSKMIAEIMSKRTMDDVKIFSEIDRRMKVKLFLFDKKEKVKSVSYERVGNLVEFQLFETEDCTAIIVDRDHYNYSLAQKIISDNYYSLSINLGKITIKDKEYLVYFYKESWRELLEEEVKDKLLKAALEFRMKTIDGFLTNAVSFFSRKHFCFLVE